MVPTPLGSIIPFFPKDERQRICPSHPSGIAQAKPVGIMTDDPLGTIVDSSAYKSQPAASALPCVGNLASGLSFANGMFSSLRMVFAKHGG
jgi:hypothetical protein